MLKAILNALDELENKYKEEYKQAYLSYNVEAQNKAVGKQNAISDIREILIDRISESISAKIISDYTKYISSLQGENND